MRLAMEKPSEYVMKPQREGGGHNLFGDELSAALSTLSREQRKKIRLPSAYNNLVGLRLKKARYTSASPFIGLSRLPRPAMNSPMNIGVRFGVSVVQGREDFRRPMGRRGVIEIDQITTIWQYPIQDRYVSARLLGCECHENTPSNQVAVQVDEE